MNLIIEEIERCVPLCDDCHEGVHNQEVAFDAARATRQHMQTLGAVRTYFGLESKPAKRSNNARRRRKPVREAIYQN